MSIYRNEIHEMEDIELLELIAKYALKVNTTDYIDVDEIIEALEYTEGTIYESVEDDILDSIHNGNWTEASKMMWSKFISPNALIDYINDYRFEQYDEAYEWFNLSSAVSITEL